MDLTRALCFLQLFLHPMMHAAHAAINRASKPTYTLDY